MSITPIDQTILIHNFNFDEKFNSKNLTKMTKLYNFFKNRNQIETNKTKVQTWYFWAKIKIKKIISKILYKLVKTLYLFFHDNKKYIYIYIYIYIVIVIVIIIIIKLYIYIFYNLI